MIIEKREGGGGEKRSERTEKESKEKGVGQLKNSWKKWDKHLKRAEKRKIYIYVYISIKNVYSYAFN